MGRGKVAIKHAPERANFVPYLITQPGAVKQRNALLSTELQTSITRRTDAKSTSLIGSLDADSIVIRAESRTT
jgi:hypothetical protein